MLAYDAIVEEALAYGWADSRPRSIDDQRSARLLTRRKPASNWSARNKARIEQITAAGRMHPAGLAAVAAAKANGAWTALDETETLGEPADLTTALDATPGARRYWDAFPRSVRRAILEWITNAKTGTTRQARISASCQSGEDPSAHRSAVTAAWPAVRVAGPGWQAGDLLDAAGQGCYGSSQQQVVGGADGGRERGAAQEADGLGGGR